MPKAKRHILSFIKQQNKRKFFVITVLLIGLVVAGVAWAHRYDHFSITKKSDPQAKEIAPSALTPTAPSKDYVYVGGKLTAIEEQ